MNWSIHAIGANVFEFISDHGFWFVGLSIVSALAGLLISTWFIVRIPEDYFCAKKRSPGVTDQPVVELLLVFMKNAVGFVLILAGLVMLVVPGQGLVTLFCGLLLMNYPGKYAMERWLVRRPGLLRSLNWIRAKKNKPPLQQSD